jgi:hypothetical protein
MASVCAIFFGQAFLDFLGIVTQTVEFFAEGFCLGQFFVAIAFLKNELATHLGGRETGVEPMVAKLRIGLALPIHDLFDVLEEVG